MDNYTLGKQIGEGSYGTVYLATSRRSSEVVAIKMSKTALKARPKSEVRKPNNPNTSPARPQSSSTHKASPKRRSLKKINSSDDSSQHAMWKEASVMKHLAHPNVVTLIDYIEQPGGTEFMIMEYMAGGDLLSEINASAKGGCSEAFARHIFTQLLSAVKFIHDQGYIHCDIKLENILLNRKFISPFPGTDPLPVVVKLTDFGFAVTYSKTEKMLCLKGSLYYASPEIVFLKEFFGPEADIWSLGVVLFSMVCGAMPLNFREKTVIKDVYDELERDGLDIEKDVSDSFHDLISRILEPVTEKRISMDHILDSDWVLNRSPRLRPPKIYLPLDKLKLEGSPRSPTSSAHGSSTGSPVYHSPATHNSNSPAHHSPNSPDVRGSPAHGSPAYLTPNTRPSSPAHRLVSPMSQTGSPSRMKGSPGRRMDSPVRTTPKEKRELFDNVMFALARSSPKRDKIVGD